jgi:hypothetical protein
VDSLAETHVELDDTDGFLVESPHGIAFLVGATTGLAFVIADLLT